MARYLLKEGTHYSFVTDSKGKPGRKRVRFSATAAKSKDRIVESDEDLVEKFGSRRFEVMGRKVQPEDDGPDEDEDTDEDGDDESGSDDGAGSDDEGEEDDDDDGEGDGDDAPAFTLKAVMHERGQWNACKVIDGELTEESVNDLYLTKKEVDILVKDHNSGA